MLSFEHKKSIFKSFQELKEKPISNDRLDYVYSASLQRGKTLATQLHRSGNGYVLGKYIDTEIIREMKYQLDPRGWISIKHFSEEELIEIISLAMVSMSKKEPLFKYERNKKDQGKLVESSGGISLSVNENLVRSCLYNWIGYGNVNAPIWFMGIEEGGAEIWRNRTKTLEQSLELRSTFNIQMDFKHVWEDLYHVSLNTFNGPNVWRYMTAFLLAFEGKQFSSNDIYDYLFVSKRLGRENANHFMGELMPLPKHSKQSIEPYVSIWASAQEYYEEVGKKRFSLIRETLEKNYGVKLIVSYDKVFTEKFLTYFSGEMKKLAHWEYGNEKYSIYKVTISHNRIVYMLSTPFFGNGRISYSGIQDAVRHMIKYT